VLWDHLKVVQRVEQKAEMTVENLVDMMVE
jgi:hypothetical protein